MIFEGFFIQAPPAVTRDGAFIIDLCPRAFGFVLNWLRSWAILKQKGKTLFTPSGDRRDYEKLDFAARFSGFKLERDDQKVWVHLMEFPEHKT